MDLLEEYATGIGLRPLAKLYGVGDNTMRRMILDAGGTIRPQGGYPGSRDPAKVERIVSARMAGAKIAVIVLRERCSSATVWQACRAAGVIGGGK
jgi:hypothetical protein